MSYWFLSILCILAVLKPVGASHFGSAIASPRSDVAEIPLLLERLRPRAVLGIMGYSAGTEEIKGELVRIAEQSPEGRAEVIRQLLRALSEPSAEDTFGFLGQYRSPIAEVLGEIRATEAIDFLVGHLGWSRDGTASLTYGTRPCVLALVMIGEPAVPKIMQALGSGECGSKGCRLNGIFALSGIGGESGMAALTELSGVEADPAMLSIERAALKRMSSSSHRNLALRVVTPKFPAVQLATSESATTVSGMQVVWTTGDGPQPQASLQSSNGDLWVGGVGLLVLRSGASVWTDSGLREREGPRFLAQSDDGSIWALTEGYLCRLEDGGWKPVDVPPVTESLNSHYGGDVNQTPLDHITGMFQSPGGEIVLIRDDAVLLYSGNVWRRLEPPNTVIRRYDKLAPPLHFGKAQATRWEAETESTRQIFRLIGRPLRQPRGPMPETNCGFAAGDGYVWLGTNRAILGLDLVNNSWRLYPRPIGLAGIMACFQADDKSLWLGDNYGHVATLNPDTGHFTVYNLADHLDQPIQRPLAKASESPSAILPAKPRNTETESPLRVSAICEDNSGRMLFGTGSGLVVFDATRGTWSLLNHQNSAVPDGRVISLTRGKHAEILIGSSEGLTLVRP